MNCDLETSVPEWIIEHPETAEVFDELGLDTSCGGKSLEYVAGQTGRDPQDVLRRIKARISGHENQNGEPDRSG